MSFSAQPTVTTEPQDLTPPNTANNTDPKSKFRQIWIGLSLIVVTILHETPAMAVFFEQGETYANNVFPDAKSITTIIIGGIRLIFIYLVAARVVKIVSGGRGEDKVSDLATELAVIFVTVLAIDAVLLLILPGG